MFGEWPSWWAPPRRRRVNLLGTTGWTRDPMWKVDIAMPSLYDLERASHDIPRERLARAAQDAQVRLLRPTPWALRAALSLADHVTRTVAGRVVRRRGTMATVTPASDQ